MSTGMATVSEISRALEIARGAKSEQIAILQCTSIYPTAPSDVNLNVIQGLQKKFKIPIGYSDHVLGPLACMAAVASGAKLLEKHITLNNSLPGADHAISSTPNEFAELICHVRLIEKMLGPSVKKPSKVEVEKKVNM